MDEFKLKNFNRFVENFKLKQQKEFKPTVEENVNEVVERLNLPEVKEKLDSIKFKGKELGAFKELSDEEVENALEKDSNKTKIIETLKKLNFKKVSQGAKAEICEVEGAKDTPTVDDIEVGAGSGSTKRHVFKSVSFTAGLEYLNSLSVRTTRMTPSIEPPVVIPTSEPTNEPTIPEGAIVLARAGSSEVTTEIPSSKTITVTSTPQVIVLKNPITGANFMYTVKLKDGVTANKTVTFDFLKNSRLVITGDYIDITAGANQDDDLIIMGKYNVINTGDKDDIVRVGSGGMVASSGYQTTTSYQRGNTINTGIGNDYIYMYGYYSDYNIDMGEGDTDRLYLLYTSYKSSNVKNVSSITQYQKETIDGEDVYRNKIIYGDGKTLDGLDGWGFQEQSPYCMFFTLLNSISHCAAKTDISKFITYTYDSNSAEYTVTFPNYSGTKSNTITVSKEDVENCKDVRTGTTDNTAFSGDFDSKLLIYSLSKLMYTNSKYNLHDQISTAYTYLFGGTAHGIGYWSFTVEKDDNGNDVAIKTEDKINTWKQNFIDLYELYNRNDETGINNMTIAFSKYVKKDTKYGIPSSHACGIKEVGKNERGEYYVVIVNPWDDADCVKFLLDDLAKLNVAINIYGYSQDELNAKLATIS